MRNLIILAVYVFFSSACLSAQAFQVEISTGINISNSSFGDNNATLFFNNRQSISPQIGPSARLVSKFELSDKHAICVGISYASIRYMHQIEGLVFTEDILANTKSMIVSQEKAPSVGALLGWQFSFFDGLISISPQVIYERVFPQDLTIETILGHTNSADLSLEKHAASELARQNLALDLVVSYRLANIGKNSLHLGCGAAYYFIPDTLQLTNTIGNRRAFNLFISYLIR